MQSLLTAKLPAFTTGSSLTGVLARAAALEAEFAAPSQRNSSGFAFLQNKIDSNSRLAGELDGFTQAAAAPSTRPLKLPAKELHQQLQRIEDALDEQPELREELALPLAEIQAVSGTTDEDILDVGALLDTRHRPGVVTGVAIACGFTVSVARFLIGAGTGQPVPMAAFDGLASGATVYLFVNSHRTRRSE